MTDDNDNEVVFLIYWQNILQDISWWLSGKESAWNIRNERHGFDPWSRKISWRKAWQPTPVLLPGECRGQRSLAGYSQWDGKESDMTL